MSRILLGLLILIAFIGCSDVEPFYYVSRTRITVWRVPILDEREYTEIIDDENVLPQAVAFCQRFTRNPVQEPVFEYWSRALLIGGDDYVYYFHYRCGRRLQ